MLKFRSLNGFPLVRIQHSPLLGGVTEWFKVTGLNPVEWLITLRGFESYRLFCVLDVRVALLIACEKAPVRIWQDA